MISSVVNLEVSIVVQIKSCNRHLIWAFLSVLLHSMFLKRYNLHLLTSGLNQFQQSIFIVVVLYTSLINQNQPFTHKHVKSKFCLSHNFINFVNFNKTVLVWRGLRLQCHQHLQDLFYEITYRLSVATYQKWFVCLPYVLIFNCSLAKEIGVLNTEI